jgi:hypothetical protein
VESEAPNSLARDVRWLFVQSFGAIFCEFTIRVQMPLMASARGSSSFWVGVLESALLLTLVLTQIPEHGMSPSAKGEQFLTGGGRKLALRRDPPSKLVKLWSAPQAAECQRVLVKEIEKDT